MDYFENRKRERATRRTQDRMHAEDARRDLQQAAVYVRALSGRYDPDDKADAMRRLADRLDEYARGWLLTPPL